MSIARSLLCAALSLGLGATTVAQQSTASAKGFDIASIKLCKDTPEVSSAGPRSSGPGGANVSTSLGRLNIQCMTTEELIYLAYATARGSRLLNNAQGEQRAFDPQRIRGGASWVRAEKYTIDATANGVSDRTVLTGVMLQALLEDRFHLKTHRDVEDRPMYALTVAKGGLKIKPNGSDGCLTASAAKSAAAIMADYRKNAGPPPCGMMQFGVKGPNRTFDIGNMTLHDFAENTLSSLVMDRHVLDKTGVTGTFSIHLEFAPDENTPAAMGSGDATGAAATDPAASIFTALEQQLGLKLERSKGPSEFIMIDHIERPSSNTPAALPTWKDNR